MRWVVNYTNILTFRVCLVGVKTGRMEKKERKIWWKIEFLLFGPEEKTREIENEVENNPSGSTFMN